MIEGELIHACIDGGIDSTSRWLQESPRSRRITVAATTQVTYEAWLPTELFLVSTAPSLPSDADLTECVAADQIPPVYDPAAGSAVLSGFAREWGACAPGRLYAECNRLKPTKCLRVEMKAAAATAFRSRDPPLAVRTWDRQGGPRPLWARLFRTLTDMAMVGWVRDAAWSMLRGSVSWGANRLSVRIGDR
eukprot:SAG31_NODE_5769_length_2335_cov_1.097496_2_plen_191_part_00